MRNVRKSRKKLSYPRLCLLSILLEFSDSIFQFGCLLAPRIGFFAPVLFHQRADCATRCVAFSVERVGFGNYASSFSVGLREIIQCRCGHTSGRERRAHSVKILPNVVEIEHLS